MAIKSSGSPDEFSSPFYMQNMDICLKWEKFFEDLGGTSQGGASAWAYLVQGRVALGLTWKIKASKSHYANTKILGLQHMNVIELLEISTKLPYRNAQNFKIRRGYFFDLFRRKQRLPLNRKYCLFGQSNPIAEQLIAYLEEPILLNQVNSIELEDNELFISLDTHNNNFQIVKSLITSIKK